MLYFLCFVFLLLLLILYLGYRNIQVLKFRTYVTDLVFLNNILDVEKSENLIRKYDFDIDHMLASYTTMLYSFQDFKKFVVVPEDFDGFLQPLNNDNLKVLECLLNNPNLKNNMIKKTISLALKNVNEFKFWRFK